MQIPELFDQELSYWTTTNQKFLGVTPIDESKDFSEIQAQIDEDCAKFWNTDKPCKLARNLNNGKLNKDASLQEKNSYRLHLNFRNLCIDVYGKYNGKEKKICAIPTPCNDLCWIINKSHYVPRCTAVRDYYTLVGRKDYETVLGEGWSYSLRTGEFTCNIKNETYKFEPTKEFIFNNKLSPRSRALLQSRIDEPLTIDNFEIAMKNLPTFVSDSIFNYKFSRMEYFEDIVLNSQKFAQPTKDILLGVNKIIGSNAKQYSSSGEKYEGCLIRSESKIFALENFRTCINIYHNEKNTEKGKKKNDYKPPFTYSDCNGFFDSFKTVTSKTAGRQRMLLDNVVLKEGMLWVIEKDGTMHNMYEYLDMPQIKRLSCLSEAPFCNNDQPKRIMMNAKMTAQAVTLKNESDPYTHRIMARVGFTDIEGYTFADSIVISESFAEKLRTYSEDILYLSKSSNLYNLITDKDVTFNLETLKQIYPNKNEAILDGYENFQVDHIDDVDKLYARVFVKWEIPFRLGDKITNLHGAKGTVGLILPDDKMPRLTKKVGHMEPGPLEIIISGFSTIRRVSLGQIFEAWANASDIDISNGEDFIAKVIEKYPKQMKKYSENSIVEFEGETNIIPVGEINIMRLYHHASTKVSCSSADFAYKRTLRFGEQEKLNMVANDCPHILKELGIRSVTKYIGSHKMINDMETLRELPANPRLALTFAELMKSIGYLIKVNRKNLTGTDYSTIDEVDTEHMNSLYKGTTELASDSKGEDD